MSDLVRYYMYKRIHGYFQNPLKGKILGISGIDNFRSLIDINAEVLDVKYPEIDLQQLPYSDNTFDYIITDQVLEHLKNPQKAINESYRVLKKGGIAIHTTCFINYLHPCPMDFWRFSTDALKYLCREFSEMLFCEGWGNRVAIFLFFFPNRLRDKLRLTTIPGPGWSIRRYIANWNENGFPIVTWIVAKK
jgi:ubiquinone/menaquinone biosynthesis C-methylase UbiE